MLKPFLVTLLLVPTSSFANGMCEDLWFSRNVIYDAHGYCFGSVLGKAMFSNEDCDTVDPELPESLQIRVDRIWDKARSNQCAIDQSRDNIAIYNRDLRRTLLAQPVADERQKACIGARVETPITLYAAPQEDAENLGRIETGDSLAYFHEAENGWEFVTILSTSNGRDPISGWTNSQMPECNKAVE